MSIMNLQFLVACAAKIQSARSPELTKSLIMQPYLKAVSTCTVNAYHADLTSRIIGFVYQAAICLAAMVVLYESFQAFRVT